MFDPISFKGRFQHVLQQVESTNNIEETRQKVLNVLVLLIEENKGIMDYRIIHDEIDTELYLKTDNGMFLYCWNKGDIYLTKIRKEDNED